MSGDRPILVSPGRRWRLPLLAGLAGYRPSWLKEDISAGLAVAAVGLPSAIAYPAIAGLPPETGIYASIWPLVAYALLGPSRQLIVGPDAATVTILAAVLSNVLAGGAAGPADRVGVAAALALGVGLLCLLARILRLGMLASFLSRPILTGFFAGVSVSILIGQIDRFTGLDISADGLVAPIVELFREAHAIHVPTLVLGFAMFALLLVAKRLRSPIPGPVLVIIVSALLSYLFDFAGRGIAVVGDVPAALPTLSLPRISMSMLPELLLGSGAIFLVCFGSGIVTARSFAVRGGYAVDPNRELTGFGAANIAAGLCGGFAVSGSDSRTAVNATIGGRTQLVSLVAASALGLALLLLTGALAVIPIPALGAILAATALSLIDLTELRNLWRVSRAEFVFALIAMWGPIGLGVLNGVVIAIGATLVYLMQKLMYPRDALLGRIPGREGFYKLHRFQGAQPVPGMTVCLIQGSLLFCNSDYVKSRLERIARERAGDGTWLVVDASAIPQLDSSGAAMLDELRSELAAANIALGLAEMHADVRALLDRAGVSARIGAGMIFASLDDAYLARTHARPPLAQPDPPDPV